MQLYCSRLVELVNLRWYPGKEGYGAKSLRFILILTDDPRVRSKLTCFCSAQLMLRQSIKFYIFFNIISTPNDFIHLRQVKEQTKLFSCFEHITLVLLQLFSHMTHFPY